jgi:AcrR family transcriptional regulator
MTEPQPASARRYAGKSLAARRSEQRERILAAARDVFAARGYAGAVIDEIVARARVSRTTFYVFFEDKEACLLAVFELGLARLAETVRAVVAETAAQRLGPWERLRAEIGAIAGAFAEDPAMARIVLIGVVGATPALEEERARARTAAAEIIEAQLEQYPYWRERTPRQRRVASLAAMAAVGETISYLVARGRIEEWESLIDPLSEFVGRALIPPERSG